MISPYQNLCDAVKVVLRSKFIGWKAYTRKGEWPKFKVLKFHLIKPEKEQIYSKVETKKQ